MANSIPIAPLQAVQTSEVYVGPRPFESTERKLFFGRDREISELLSLVISNRVVLCYAPSGAGKTSLINAGLSPRLQKEGFDVLPSTRVRGLIPEGIDQHKVSNLYVFNALISLAGKEAMASELTGCSLAKFLSERTPLIDQDGFVASRILIFDQFEELLTVYPERWQEREGFFQQVHNALQADPLLRIVFVMREDFLARIEPFVRLLKPFPQARFHLDLLGKEGAQAAVTGPLQGTDRHYKEGVVAALIEELLKVRVETAPGMAVDVVGEYVEPVQLQVVCRNLWMSLPLNVQEISIEHLKAYGDVNQALQDFYESCVAKAKTIRGANELSIRQWFDEQLITPAGTRGIVFYDMKRTAYLPNSVVESLENQHLIRGEWRAGSRWYELTHDRFIEPVQRANANWRAQRQAKRTKLLLTAAIPLLIGLVLFAGMLGARQSASQAVGVPTIAAAQTAAQTTALVAEVQIEEARDDAAFAKSRQLAAEALLVDDSDLSLLLAIQANQTKDTPEARRSLHKILSRQPAVDGKFLNEFVPDIVSATLLKRWISQDRWAASVAFSPDGQRILSGGEGAMLTLWDVATTELVKFPLNGHERTVQGVAFSPDGSLMVSAGQDGQVLLWNPTNGQLVGDPLRSHTGWVNSVAFSPDGKRLASAGDDGIVRIWDLASGQPQEKVQEVQTHQNDVWSVAWSPDGNYLASAGTDSTVRLYDTDKFEEAFVLIGHRGVVRAVAWAPDSQSLASGSYIEETNRTSGEVIIWDVRSGKAITRTPADDFRSVRTLAFHPSGKILAMGLYDGHIILSDTNYKQANNYQLKGDEFSAHNNRVMSIAFSPDGRYMASSSLDRTIAVWDLVPPTRSIAMSPTGGLLAASNGASISLWDISSNRTTPVTVLAQHTEDVLALAFSPDGSSLASSGRDDTIRLWDVINGQPLDPPLRGSGDILTIDIGPDGLTLASADENGTILLWDLAGHNQIRKFDHSVPVIKVSFRDGGKKLQLADQDGRLIMLDVKTGQETQVENLPTPHAGVPIVSLAFSPNGQKAAFFRKAGAGFLNDEARAHGIEISVWSQSFDPRVNPDDIDFVIVKASDGLQVDRNFTEFLKQIQSVPIRGALHIFRPDQPWQEQADLFLSTVLGQGFHFYTLDLEFESADSSTTFLSDAKQWLQYVDEKVEERVLLQISSRSISYLGSSENWIEAWPLLIVSYSLEPDRNGLPFLPPGIQNWKIWQYTDTALGAVYGIGGDSVRLDVYNGTPLDMWEWLNIAAFSIYDRNSEKLFRPNQSLQVMSPNGIVFSPNSSYIASGGLGMVSLLDANSGEELSTLVLGGRTVLSLGFTPHSDALAIGTDEGTVLLWDLRLLSDGSQAAATIEIACSQVNRNFTESEVQQYLGNLSKGSTCPNSP